MKKIKLCLVVDSGVIEKKGKVSLELVVDQALDGGVDMVQLRCKDEDTGDFIAKGIAVKKILHKKKIPLIINDRVDIALAIGANGVHLGAKDMPFEMARKLLYRRWGRKSIIGLSVENPSQAAALNNIEGISYLGVGAIFPTQSKKVDFIWGLAALKKFCSISNHHLMAIGGIDNHNISSVLSAGVDSVAVISAICLADNVKKATADLKSNMILK